MPFFFFKFQARKSSATRQLLDLIPKDKRKLRWFLTPQEVSDFTTGARRIKPFKPIFIPKDDSSRESETESPLNTFRSTVSNQEVGYHNQFVKRKVSEQMTTQRNEPHADRLNKTSQIHESEGKHMIRSKDLNKHVRRLSEIPRGLRNGDTYQNSNITPRKKRDLSLPRIT